MAAISGALAWHYHYPWPQRAPGLVEAAFDPLAERRLPLLNVAEEHVFYWNRTVSWLISMPRAEQILEVAQRQGCRT